MTEKKLRTLEDKCYDAESKLNSALSELALAAESVLGHTVVADLCHGGEIEFRTADELGVLDDFECYRMEDIISMLK